MVELELENLDTSPFTDQAQRDIKVRRFYTLCKQTQR